MMFDDEFHYLDRVKVGKHGKVMEVYESFPIGKMATLIAPNGERLVVRWDEMKMVSPYRDWAALRAEQHARIAVAAKIADLFPLAA